MMYRERNYTEVAGEALEQLSKGGAFLTTCYDGKVNTMTIGWGTVGFFWGVPAVTVYVRYSRHTYDLLDKAGEFTVSFPKLGHLAKELVVCGTKSGRNIDKFDECGFRKIESVTVKPPTIGQCRIHFECKTIYRQAMEPGLIREQFKQQFYKKNNDFHVVYYGEITRCHVDE